MTERRSCAESPIEFSDGTNLPQIPYGSETNEWSSDPCHDCGAPKGGFHHGGCDAEQCPRCGGQLISCGCLDDPDDIVGDVVGRPHLPAEVVEWLLGPRPARSTLDDVADGIRKNIADAGWSAIAIGGGPCACCGKVDHQGPIFLYTIGFSETFTAPEIVVFGLPPTSAHGLAAVIAAHLRAGDSFAANTVYDDLTDLPVAFIEVPKDEFSGRLNHAVELYGYDFEALQLVWPDSNGRFPWDEGFEEVLREEQPLLGAWMGVRW